MYITHLKIQNPTNPFWRDRFDSKLGGLVLPDLPPDVGVNYIKTLKKFAKTTLLYRVKWFQNNEYNLINIWEAKDDYDSFYTAVNGAIFFAEYETQGYTVDFSKESISDHIANLVILGTLEKPDRIIQVLSPALNIPTSPNAPLQFHD
jgi:hypothetical protein